MTIALPWTQAQARELVVGAVLAEATRTRELANEEAAAAARLQAVQRGQMIRAQQRARAEEGRGGLRAEMYRRERRSVRRRQR